MGHLVGWDRYFTECIYLFNVDVLSWEIGDGQAQASLIGFQLSLCLSLVLVLGHVQLMLTHPLYTHTLKSLMILSNLIMI